LAPFFIAHGVEPRLDNSDLSLLVQDKLHLCCHAMQDRTGRRSYVQVC